MIQKYIFTVSAFLSLSFSTAYSMQDNQPQNNQYSLIQSIKKCFIRKNKPCLGSKKRDGAGIYWCLPCIGATVTKSILYGACLSNGENCAEASKILWCGLSKNAHCGDSFSTACASTAVVSSDVLCVASGIMGLLVCTECCTLKGCRRNNSYETLN